MITRNRSDHRSDLCDKMGGCSIIDNHVFGVNPKYDYSRKNHSNKLKGNLYVFFTKSYGLPIRYFILIVFFWQNRNFMKK